MPRNEDIAVSELLLDPENARLGTVQTTQPSTALALAAQQGRRLVNLAADIVEEGLDPAQPLTVLATGKGDRRRRYVVLEGNRRLLAIKALETPSLVAGALKPADLRKLQGLALKYKNNPIDVVPCVMYELPDAREAYKRIMNRHNGAQDGVGLVEWDSNEKDRFAARHGDGRARSAAGQVLDFIDVVDGPHASKVKISTTLERILTSPEIKEALGLQKVDGELVSWYPKDEVAKGIRKIVDELRTQTIKVTDVYHAPDRREYLKSFKRTQLPTRSKKLKDPVKLSDLAAGKSTPVPTKKKAAKPKPKQPRTAVAAADAQINPAPPRLNEIFNELVSLSADTYANAGSVLLRVFLELSVDDYIVREKVMSPKVMQSSGLAKRMKAVADHLGTKGAINSDLKKAAYKIADTQHTIAAGVTTFHQYVHNAYVHPKPSELRTAWDELQPFLEAVWK